MIGTSGKSDNLLDPVNAIAFNLPLLIKGITMAGGIIATCTSPATRAFNDGALPL